MKNYAIPLQQLICGGMERSSELYISVRSLVRH